MIRVLHLLLIVATVTSRAASQEYSLLDIRADIDPLFGGTVNNQGQIGGGYRLTTNTAAIYSNANLTVLNNPSGRPFRVLGFADTQELIGEITRNDLYVGVGFDRNGHFFEFPLFEGGIVTRPLAMANSGRAAGIANSTAGDGIFTYYDGEATFLGTPRNGVNLDVHSVNSSGVVLGNMYRQDEHGDWLGAFMYDPNLASFSTTWDGLRDINDRGQMIFRRYVNGVWHGFRAESDGTLTDLGTEFFPRYINESGDMIGADEGGSIPKLWLGGQIFEIDSLVPEEWRVESAGQLNNQGQFVVNASKPGYRTQLLLTPVPEPSAFVTFGAGLGLLAWNRRSRSHRK